MNFYLDKRRFDVVNYRYKGVVKRLKAKEPVYCKLCGREVKEPQYDINFEPMVGRAGWHMTFNTRMRVCGECSQNLIAYVEKWFRFCNKTDIYKKKYMGK